MLWAHGPKAAYMHYLDPSLLAEVATMQCVQMEAVFLSTPHDNSVTTL